MTKPKYDLSNLGGQGLLLAALLAVSTQATAAWPHADPNTARGMADSCSSIVDTMAGRIPEGLSDEEQGAYITAGGVCLGFIKGLLTATSYATSRGLSSPYCLPARVDELQVARVFIKSVNDNPAHEHIPAGPALMAVLAGTWPCPGN